MRLILVGLSHKSASVELRERIACIRPQTVAERLRAMGFGEAVVLSTCNRFEIYACPDGLASGQAKEAVISLLGQLSDTVLASQVYVHEGPSAVKHLFSVASGLDSLVVGETEILGQVKDAYESARAGGMTGKFTNVLFQRALFTGKKVRAETAIAVGQTSVASVAVQLAESIFGDLRGSEVLVLGAGTMAELSARHLLSKKVAKLSISNRTRERAEALCGKLNAEPVAWEDYPRALERADVVISSTGSDRPILTREIVAAALGPRAGRSLFIIDIAMPRDVEEEVHGLEHVYLYRLADLEAIASENLKERLGEVERARGLAQSKAEEFASWHDSVAEGREISLKHTEAAG